MSDHHNIHESKDSFSEYLRQRLANHPTPPDDLCWDEIEARIPRKRPLSPVWITLTAAASLLLAVFLLNQMLTKEDAPSQDTMAHVKTTTQQNGMPEDKKPADTDPKSSRQKSSEQNDNQTDIEQRYSEQNDINQKGSDQKDTDRKSFGQQNTEQKSSEQKDIDQKSFGQQNTDPKSSEQKDIDQTDTEQRYSGQEEDKQRSYGQRSSNRKGSKQNVPDKQEAVENVHEAGHPTVEREHTIRQNENLVAYSTEAKRSSKKRDGWQLSAGFGSDGGIRAFLDSKLLSSPQDASPGGSNDYQNPGDSGEDGADEDNKDGNNGENSTYSCGSHKYESNNGLSNGLRNGAMESNELRRGISEDNITDKQYAIPLSFGITVRKKLNKTLGIETGLVYTYLSTDLEISGKNYREATLKLHYLGIPARLIVNIWDNGSWNVYASGGGMVEKGLQSIYKPTNFHLNKSEEGGWKEKDHISGLQWSLNGGMGLSYRLYKEMNLFLEPGFSYYFDCNQPISKRTEDPLNFDLRIGVRYDF